EPSRAAPSRAEVGSGGYGGASGCKPSSSRRSFARLPPPFGHCPAGRATIVDGASDRVASRECDFLSCLPHTVDDRS
ncbi:unnamed protein product, partial [Soboliphyme baturini]|uniref:Os08g0170800 protein n=1 Tax=Soboliphyme baturini TaxID=241478 RepID=A0A183IW86_9BILA